MRTDKIFDNSIQLLRGYARFNVATNLGESLTHQNVVLTEQLDLFLDTKAILPRLVFR